MKYKKLKRNFYTRETLVVAKDLLGKYIVRIFRGKIIAGKIREVEVYFGPKDKASHAFGGKLTPRNRAEWLIGGHIYIYLVYGLHWQFNISTSQAGTPECILIRALELPAGESALAASGPGKLCRYLHLDKSFYAEDLTKSKRIWLENRGENIKPLGIIATPRIGINYAGKYWAGKKWRFIIKK